MLNQKIIDMKIKSLSLLILFLGVYLIGSSQEFEKGSKVLNLGVGFGGYGTWGYNVAVPPVSASVEIGILDGIIDKGSIGVGGYIGYASYKQDGNWAGDEYWTYNRLFLGARGVFHYPLIEKLDTYGGLMLGFNSYMWKWHGTAYDPIEPGNSGIGSSIFVGGRYYFNDKFAGMAELGYGISYLNLGIALKF
jgi:hypothetical protein